MAFDYDGRGRDGGQSRFRAGVRTASDDLREDVADLGGCPVPLQDWFLTAEERGNPASGIPTWCDGKPAEPLIHGATYFDRLVDEVEALGDGDHLFFTDWRGDPDERMRRRRPDRRRAVRAGRQARRGGQGADVALAPRQARSTARRRTATSATTIEAAGGEVLLDQRVRRGGSHHQKLVVLRHPDEPERDVAFAGGIDLCHSRRDDADAPRRPAAGRDGRARTATDPPWHDVQLALRGPVVGALDTVVPRALERPDAAGPARARSPTLQDKLRARRPAAPTRCPPQPPDPPRVRPARHPGAAHLPGDAPARTRSRRDGERTVARGYTKAIKPGPPADLPGGPVPVVDRGGPAVRRRAARPTRTCTWSRSCRGTRTWTAGSRCRPTRSAASRRIELCRKAGAGPGARLRRGEPRGHAGLRARQGLRRRRRLGQRRQRQLQPPVVDARQRAVLRGARRDAATSGRRATRPGSATAPGVFARDLRLRAVREHLDRATDDDDDLIDPDDAGTPRSTPPRTRCDDWHARRPGGPAAARPAAPARARAAAAGTSGSGRSRRTG